MRPLLILAAASLCACALTGCPTTAADAFAAYDRNYDRAATLGARADSHGEGKAYVEFTISRRPRPDFTLSPPSAATLAR